ncbi:copper amine oxidase N-terminal domain-containing protein [Paenibacillus sanguinis]|uniref:copper amine oxidase N-terminal domain-containing protein n=1 Tax=Paenibacillus sanguinis TaxID=225906 RepID=UPI00035E2575|nr:copper amine oxidase N-terminal domain-containing protein [Paenibacillus sanguinis]
MRFKKAIILSTALALTISGAALTNPVYAAKATKTIKAVYNDISIVYNGTILPSDAATEPFMINGTTYLPLRMVGTALDKKVSWDSANKRVVIVDNGITIDQSTVTSLNNQINSLSQQLAAAKSEAASKDAMIEQLKKEKEDLQKKANDKDDVDLDDLEDDLNHDYGDYKSTEAEIVLSGNERNVTLRVNVDEKGWNDLSNSQKKSFIQDIVDEIYDSYKSVKISGTVRNDRNSNTLSTISVTSSGTASLKDKSSSSSDLGDLEDDLNDDYGTYQSVDFDIKLSGDEDDITVKIYVDRKDWEGLSSSRKSSFKKAIIDDIEDEYDDADINGYIYDEDKTSSRLDDFSN